LRFVRYRRFQSCTTMLTGRRQGPLNRVLGPFACFDRTPTVSGPIHPWGCGCWGLRIRGRRSGGTGNGRPGAGNRSAVWHHRVRACQAWGPVTRTGSGSASKQSNGRGALAPRGQRSGWKVQRFSGFRWTIDGATHGRPLSCQKQHTGLDDRLGKPHQRPIVLHRPTSPAPTNAGSTQLRIRHEVGPVPPGL